MLPPPDPANPQAVPTAPLRLDYLDGLRAVAALYVVLFHAVMGFQKAELPKFARAGARFLAFGHEAVAIFIVLSGYCLMLSALRSGGSSERVPLGPFVARRAFRILPPYYATVLYSLGIIALVPALQPATGSGTIWDGTTPAWDAGALVSHTFLIHNWFPEWIHRINGPLWSVASEWQIYFFLPLVFYPLWRRSGLLGLLCAGALLGYAPLVLPEFGARSAITWYLLLFATGMAAAAVQLSERPLETRLRKLPWGRLALVLTLFCAIGGLAFAPVWFRYMPVTDFLVGLTTATLLLHFSGHILERRPGPGPLALRVLRSRPLLAIGHYSYSLYLTHLPILALCFFVLRPLPLSPLGHTLLLTVLGTALSLGFAYAFYRVVERHFIGSPKAFFSRRKSVVRA